MKERTGTGRGYPTSLGAKGQKEIASIRDRIVQNRLQGNRKIIMNLLKVPEKHRPAIYAFLKPAGTGSCIGLVVSMNKDSFKVQKEFNEARETVQFINVEKIDILSTLDLVAQIEILRKALKRQQDAMNEISEIIRR